MLLAFHAIMTDSLNVILITEGILRPFTPSPPQVEIEIPEDYESDGSTVSLVRVSVKEPKICRERLDDTCLDIWLVSFKIHMCALHIIILVIMSLTATRTLEYL